MTVFEVYITNLGKYAEGQLAGETLKFPATTEEVQSLLKNIGVDGVRYEEFFSAQRRRSFCHMQRLITVEDYGQICMGSTLGNLPSIRVDAAGQVYSQHKGVALMQTAYQPAGSKTGRPKCAINYHRFHKRVT